jgi:tetratricopeptide (TPR) repeat protein
MIAVRRLYSAALLLACAGSVHGQAAPPQDSISNEAFVIEQSRTTWRFEEDGTARRETYLRVKVQSEAGVQRWGQVIVGYNAANERLDMAFVRVHKADGSVAATPADAVQDLSSPVERIAPVYTDFRQRHVQLGKAYMNLHRVDDARKEFSRAVEISPTPLTWNDVAYELSLGSVDLDTAQRYAESAVAAETASSRNLDLDHVDARALGVVSSLAAYWDTLGWVFFAKGDLAQAEKYVAALAADNPAQIVREHFVALAGPASRPDAAASERKQALETARTVALDFKGPPGKKADVAVLLSAPNVIDGMRFIEGDRDLATAAASLKILPLEGIFPGDSPAKLLRRGTLSCAAPARCSLTLVLPSDAKPVK